MPGGILTYFAYGSNMSRRRLRARAPSARALGCGWLVGYELRFHKAGMDGSAKCDAFHTGDPRHCVIGAIYTIDARDKPGLDRAEGLGRGYRESALTVTDAEAGDLAVFTYLATRIDRDLRPYPWYRYHVLVGAREAGMPADYIERIERIRCAPDPDRLRNARELAIYDQLIS